MASLQTQMGPPMLPAYSLRVKLFGSHPDAGDKPLQCFRVVTNPQATVREFCEEASRIYAINYGESLAVKRVQDEIGFDVTQGEILGNLFPNASIVRFIQARAVAGIRDSVPPDSALRFDTRSVGHQHRKRERESSIGSGGGSPGSAELSNKRQRVLDITPDHPLPSREEGLQNGVAEDRGVIRQGGRIADDSKESLPSNAQSGKAATGLGRARIPETPPPGHGFGDTQLRNDTFTDSKRKVGDPILPSHAHSAPSKATVARSSSRASNRGQTKNSSNIVQRPIERGTPIAETSPRSQDAHPPILPSGASTTNRKSITPILPPPKMNGKAPTKSADEEGVYGDFGPDAETEGILRDKKATLKTRNSPKPGLQSLDHANNKPKGTPPSGRRPKNGPQDQPVLTQRKSPLSPAGTDQRQAEDREESKERRTAAKAAAEAAERRSREAEIVEAAEEAKRKAEAARLKKEKEAKLEQERQAAGKADAANVEAERLKLQREKAESGAIKMKQGMEAAPKTQPSLKRKASSDSSQARSASPVVPKLTQSSRPQSSTPFIPTGRKPALKSSSSFSRSVSSSSPVITRTSPPLSNANVGIEAAMPLPKGRRVSFTDQIEVMEKKPKSNGETSTPKSRPNVSLAAPQGRRETPIPPPKFQLNAARNQSPVASRPVNSPILPPNASQASKTAPKATSSQQTPAPKLSQATRITPRRTKEAQVETMKIVNDAAKVKATSPPATKNAVVEISSDESESDSEDSEDAEEQSLPARQPSRSKSADGLTPRPSAPIPTQPTELPPKKDSEDDESDSASTQDPTPERDSRSPVIFKQPTPPTRNEQPLTAISTDPSDEEMGEAVAEQDDFQSPNPSKSSSSRSDPEIQVANSSPPILRPPTSTSHPRPTAKQASTPPQSSLIPSSSQQPALRPATKRTQPQPHNPPSDAFSDAHIQDEIDQQLTSSLPQSTALPLPNPAHHTNTSTTPLPLTKSISRLSTSTSNTPTPRQTPELKVGASLSRLNSLKPVFGAKDKGGGTAGKNSVVARSGQVLGRMARGLGFGRGMGMDGSGEWEGKGEEEEEEEDEESEESESDDDEEEEDERAAEAINKVQGTAAPPPAAAARGGVKGREEETSTSGSDSDSDSNSDSNSDSDSGESEDEAERIKRELKAQIERVAREEVGVDVTATARRKGDGVGTGTGSSQVEKGEVGKLGRKGRKSGGRIVSGYQFSQPV